MSRAKLEGFQTGAFELSLHQQFIEQRNYVCIQYVCMVGDEQCFYGLILLGTSADLLLPV